MLLDTRACFIDVAGIASPVYSARQFIKYSLGIVLVKQNKSSFKWRHFEPTVILLCVRWYCRYQLSYRDLEEMMRERGLEVDHSTVSDCVKTPVLF